MYHHIHLKIHQHILRHLTEKILITVKNDSPDKGGIRGCNLNHDKMTIWYNFQYVDLIEML